MFKFKRSKAILCLQSSQPTSPFASHIRGMVTMALGLNLITPFAAPIPKSSDMYIYIVYCNPYNYDHKPTLLPLFFVTWPYNTIPRDQNKGDKRARSMSFAGARRTIEVAHMQGPELCKILGML